MSDTKLCKDCEHIMNKKPLPFCGSSRTEDLVTGEKFRVCLIERLDGIGRCGTMGNNFTKNKPATKK